MPNDNTPAARRENLHGTVDLTYRNGLIQPGLAPRTRNGVLVFAVPFGYVRAASCAPRMDRPC